MTGLKRSWVDSANSAETDFPLNNLPYGVYDKGDEEVFCGVAIGDYILNLTKLEEDQVLDLGLGVSLFGWGTFDPLIDEGQQVWDQLRTWCETVLKEGSPVEKTIAPYLDAREGVRMHMPFEVVEYTDFYAGKNHAFNVGTMFRGPENALPPNWLSIPIGYNGRASSVVISGTDVTRPNGQLKGPDDELPHFGPCARWDFELEMGAIVGKPSEGMVSVKEADDMIFGYVLLNDWSARDIQAWEYQPLGPFQAKATATTISPWIVTKAALEPFRTSTPEGERPLLPYLKEPGPMLYDIDLEVSVAPEGKPETVVTRTNYKEMYYSAAQQLAHHTTSGCPMRPGDLLGSGTISGETKESRGSMLELSWGGKEPLTLDSGETRTFLEDGDTVTFRGAAKGNDYKIGFGECVGKTLPAAEIPDWAKE
ncbi:MAG TPA: fumarylacetoacetase [Maritimibacter sp.]|nr:fumarylacetoacetase [Maritimibacter sp.]